MKPILTAVRECCAAGSTWGHANSANTSDLAGWANCASGPLFAPPGRLVYSPPFGAFVFDADVDLLGLSSLLNLVHTPK
ncbi:MAG: hypothetical protein HY287_14395 [Planctomycetes bacterium]|nr:hypothetical protein [Planctomycetota bacterium]MBI3835512.1 hypothetical protein [Planctomycetota bacterium]